MDGNRTIAETLYERDFAAWAAEQGRALRAGDHEAVDWENVIEEIETLGRSERSALRSAILLILEHRLKLDHGLRDEPRRGWKRTVTVQRIHARKRLEDNPSLRPDVPSLILAEYEAARLIALASFEKYEEANIAHYRAVLPLECPYSETDVLG